MTVDNKDGIYHGNHEGSNTPSGSSKQTSGTKTTRSKETASRAEKTRPKVDKVVVHEVDGTTELTISMSTDGYTVYKMYDGTDSKVLYIDCWTHDRRLWRSTRFRHKSNAGNRRNRSLLMNNDSINKMNLSPSDVYEKRKKLLEPIMKRTPHNGYDAAGCSYHGKRPDEKSDKRHIESMEISGEYTQGRYG